MLAGGKQSTTMSLAQMRRQMQHHFGLPTIPGTLYRTPNLFIDVFTCVVLYV